MFDEVVTEIHTHTHTNTYKHTHTHIYMYIHLYLVYNLNPEGIIYIHVQMKLLSFGSTSCAL